MFGCCPMCGQRIEHYDGTRHMTLGRLTVDVYTHEVTVDGEVRCIGRRVGGGKQYPGHGSATKILIALLRADRPMGIGELLEEAGSPRSHPTMVTSALSHIRAGIGDAVEIRSHYRRGWEIRERRALGFAQHLRASLDQWQPHEVGKAKW